MLINNAKEYKKHVTKPSFVSQNIFIKTFDAIHEIKPVLTLDKRIYVEFSFLDLRKHWMYDFHYNYIKKKYNANLFFKDTDSLVYEIETEDISEDFYRHKNLFDFSYYRQDSKSFNPINQKIIGKMKDEFKAKIINEFSGLKSKMYSLVTVGNDEIKKAKGVNKNTVKNA